MNHTETMAVNQSFTAPTNENLSRDLRQAIKIINAEYQQIDWEDQTFLNRVLSDALAKSRSKGGEIYASSKTRKR